MRFLNNHRPTQTVGARVLAHRFAIACGDLPYETQAFLRRISARFIEMVARPYPPKSAALRAERSEGIAEGRESVPCLLCESGGQGTARPTEMGRALAKAVRVIRGLILVLALGAVSSAFAATGSSPEFKLDLRGLGPWQRHTAAASEALTYSSAWATNAASGAKAVVKVMPVLKTKPKYLVIDLSGGTNATSYGISYLDEVPGGTWSDEYKTSKLVLRHIPAGSFIMGGRATDYPGAVNTNLHMVTITRDFYMGVFEVTQRQWELVMGTRPSSFTNETAYATRPVETISHCAVRGGIVSTFCPLSEQQDYSSFMSTIVRRTSLSGFDLPTSAQWEMACRAGTSTAYNSGKNISDMESCTEANEIARYKYNSHRQEYVFKSNERYAFDTSVGTAKTGMYLSNSLGIYDMHGNVWEWCLDSTNQCSVMESIDPLECNDDPDTSVARGGSWCDYAAALRSSKINCGVIINENGETVYKNVGFRLCLQGGDLPDLTSASTLVNESGAGSQSWTPTRSGAYYLTHSTMNGATNVQLASAWFEVSGCTLTLEPQGELTNGVTIAITGADEGWTVYYTTNGLAPSKASEPYSGPFSLPESGTVRAVAYNEQGVASEEAMTTFTLHDALSVVGAVARQRYPWNGMVDVDLELKGDPEKKYQVEVEAKDLDGGTNLPVRTIVVGRAVPSAPQSQGNAVSLEGDCGGQGLPALPPGEYRLTWNADADIAADGEFPRVAVTVKATRPSVVAAYNRSLSIAVDGYTGAETLTNVPVLVRLSTNITGFVYSDFASPTNGADLAFFDANENELSYEIDEWHTNGESLVWVKLPTLAKGSKFTCAYGNVDAFVSNASDKDGSSSSDAIGTIASTERARMKHEVWAEYAGVWHMNEDSGTAYDSTAHGLDALPSCGTNELADVSQMVAYENGACGRARVNSITDAFNGNYLEVPSYDALKLQSHFVVSGWYHGMVNRLYPRFFSRKQFWTDENGWEVSMCGNQTGDARGASGRPSPGIAFCDLRTDWLLVTCAYDGDVVTISTNGVFCNSGSISPASDNGLPLSIGNISGGLDWSFVGQYDEIRLRGGSLSAARIKADYDMIANRKFCTYGAVKKGAE